MSARALDLQQQIATILVGEKTADAVVAIMLVTAGTALMLNETPETAKAWLHVLADDAARQAEHNWPSRAHWIEIQQRLNEVARA